MHNNMLYCRTEPVTVLQQTPHPSQTSTADKLSNRPGTIIGSGTQITDPVDYFHNKPGDAPHQIVLQVRSFHSFHSHLVIFVIIMQFIYVAH